MWQLARSPVPIGEPVQRLRHRTRRAAHDWSGSTRPTSSSWYTSGKLMKLPVVKYWSRSSGCCAASVTSCTRSGCLGRCDTSGDAFSNTNAHAFHDVRRDAAGGRQIQLIRFRRHEHQRAALRLHVVAHQRQQPVGKRAGIAGDGVECEQAVQQIQGPGASVGALHCGGAIQYAPAPTDQRPMPTVVRPNQHDGLRDELLHRPGRRRPVMPPPQTR